MILFVENVFVWECPLFANDTIQTRKTAVASFRSPLRSRAAHLRLSPESLLPLTQDDYAKTIGLPVNNMLLLFRYKSIAN